MATKPRAVRFSSEDEDLIQEFLELNPFLDFSTLARMAILQFMKNPKFEILPLGSNKSQAEKTKKRLTIQNSETRINELNINNQ